MAASGLRPRSLCPHHHSRRAVRSAGRQVLRGESMREKKFENIFGGSSSRVKEVTQSIVDLTGSVKSFN